MLFYLNCLSQTQQYMLALKIQLLLPALFGLSTAVSFCQAQAYKTVAAAPMSATFTSAPGDSALRADLYREAELLKQGIAHRQPNESDTTFLKRLFPASFFAGRLIRYAWRPSAFGKQLFFSYRERDAQGSEGEGTHLFVLDPFQPTTYAVQVLLLEPIGDITNLASLFFTDVDQDGQKELLALVYAEVQQVDTHEDGEQLIGRLSHWQTQIFRYVGLNRTGRPFYRRDTTPRPYLNGLRTATDVRRALARSARP
jgi:hypothetical protein